MSNRIDIESKQRVRASLALRPEASPRAVQCVIRVMLPPFVRQSSAPAVMLGVAGLYQSADRCPDKREKRREVAVKHDAHHDQKKGYLYNR